jgi:hypothetical protein
VIFCSGAPSSPASTCAIATVPTKRRRSWLIPSDVTHSTRALARRLSARSQHVCATFCGRRSSRVVKRRYSLMLLFLALAHSNNHWLYHGITIRRKVRCKAAIEVFAKVASALQTREVLVLWSVRTSPKRTSPFERRRSGGNGRASLRHLIALLSRPNEITSKRDALAQVWPAPRRW